MNNKIEGTTKALSVFFLPDGASGEAWIQIAYGCRTLEELLAGCKEGFQTLPVEKKKRGHVLMGAPNDEHILSKDLGHATLFDHDAATRLANNSHRGFRHTERRSRDFKSILEQQYCSITEAQPENQDEDGSKDLAFA